MGIFSEYRAVDVAGRTVWLIAKHILAPVQGTIYLLCADGEPLGVFRYGAWPRSGEIVAEMRGASGEAVRIELAVRQWRGLHTQFELRVDGAVVEFPELSERALESRVPGLVERVRRLIGEVVTLENELPLPPRQTVRLEPGKIPGEGVGRPLGIEPELLGTTPRAVGLTGRGRWKRRGYAALMVFFLVFPSALIGPGVWHRERARQQGVATVGRVVDKTRLPQNGQTRVDYAYTAEGREYREVTKDIDDALYGRMRVGGPIEVRYVTGHGAWHHAAGLGEVQTARDLRVIKWLTGLGGALGVFLFGVTLLDQGAKLRLARWGRAELPQLDDWEKSVQARVREMFPFARDGSDTRLVDPRRPSHNIRYRMLEDVEFQARDRLRGEWLNAVTRGDLAAVNEWLNRGVDVTCAHAGRTALLAAGEAGYADVARALLDRGADGPLELLAAVRFGCWAAADGLLRLGIRPGGISTTTGISIAPREVLWAAVESGAPMELVGRLVEAGCQIDATDEEGHTALLLAVAGEDLSMVEALLRLGASTERCDAEGNDALVYARRLCSDPDPFLKVLREARRAAPWHPEA